MQNNSNKQTRLKNSFVHILLLQLADYKQSTGNNEKLQSGVLFNPIFLAILVKHFIAFIMKIKWKDEKH